MTISTTLHRVQILLPLLQEQPEPGVVLDAFAAAVGLLERAGSEEPVIREALLLLKVEDLPTDEALLQKMNTLSLTALKVRWDEEAWRKANPVSLPLDLAEQGRLLLEGGTLEAADRAAIFTEADDLLSIAFVKQSLGCTLPSALLCSAARLRRRLWAGATPLVTARLATWVEQQVTERGGMDTLTAFFWSPPDAPFEETVPQFV